MNDLAARLDGIVQTSQEVATAATRTRELVSQPGQAHEALRSLLLLHEAITGLARETGLLVPEGGLP